ncbi:MAG: hypothetical protein ABR517_08795 [Thermoanaerobaculia bacterium]
MRRRIVGLILAVACAGCGSIADYYRVDPLDVQPTTAVTETIEQKLESGLVSALAACTGGPCRDENKITILYTLLALSESRCSEHKAAILANSDTFNASTSLSALLFSTAGALVSSVEVAGVLSGLAAVATGTRAVGNDEVYEKTLVPAILRAIDENRSGTLNRIEFNVQTRLSSYSMQEIARDVIAHHEKCSFAQGLQYLSESLQRSEACQGVRLREDDLISKLKDSQTNKIGTAADKDFLEKLYLSDLTLLRKKNADCF